MPSKQLVEKRNVLQAKQAELDKVFEEAYAGGSEADYSRVKCLGENLTVAAVGERITSMNKEIADLLTDVKSLQNLEQIESENRQRERKAGGGTGMRHQESEGDQAKSFADLILATDPMREAKSAGFNALASRSGKILTMIEGHSLFANRPKAVTIGGLGSGTTGVQMPQRMAGIVDLPRQELRVRDLIPVTNMTSGNSFDFVKQVARFGGASMHVEAEAKSQSDFTWSAERGDIRTIAHYVKASRQALDDVTWLRSALDSEMRYGVLLKEESQILNGDGTGVNLDGIIPQATAYSTALDVANDTKLDKIRHALYQARSIGLATFAPDGIVLNPKDMHDIELIKTNEGTTANQGMYVIGNPRDGNRITMLWGRPVVESDSITIGRFLVGAFGTGARLFDRMQLMVAIAYENEDDFIKNLATILAEERVGLAVTRPDAFVEGAF